MNREKIKNRKNLVLTIIFFALFVNAQSNTIVDSGSVQGMWLKQNSPYFINGDIYIKKGKKLEIQAGVKVIVNGHYRIRVYGNLHIAGNHQDSILFSPSNKNTGWKGIIYYPSSIMEDSVVINYARFEYGRNLTYSFKTDTGVLFIIGRDRVKLSNSTFYKNVGTFYAGLTIKDASLEINKCSFLEHEGLDDRPLPSSSGASAFSFTNCSGNVSNVAVIKCKNWAPNYPDDEINGLGGGTAGVRSCSLTFYKCVFDSNYSAKGAPALVIGGPKSKVNLLKCNFLNNRSREGAALNCSFDGPSSAVINLDSCFFYQNSAARNEISDIRLSNTNIFAEVLICKNTLFQGAKGGVSVDIFNNGNAVFKNCVFENNQTSYCISADKFSELTLQNTRITNNNGGIFMFRDSDLKMYNCNVSYNGVKTDSFSGGIYIVDDFRVYEICNSIIVGNKSMGRDRNIITSKWVEITDFHNNILSGGLKSCVRLDYTNPIPVILPIIIQQQSNIIDTMPHFIEGPIDYGVHGYAATLDFDYINNCDTIPSYIVDRGSLDVIDVPYYDVFPVIDVNGNKRVKCDNIDIGPIELEGPANALSATILADSIYGCSGVDTFFETNICGASVDFQWQLKSQSNTWANLDSSLYFDLQNSGEYRLLLSQNSCNNWDTVHAFYEKVPLPKPDLGKDRTLSINEELTFYPGSYKKYQWYNGNTIPTYRFIKQDTGVYKVWVRVFDQYNCIGSDTAIVRVFNTNGFYKFETEPPRIYPNPASSKVSIESSSPISSIEILNSCGMVKIQNLKKREHSIDITELPSGVYTLKVNTLDGVFVKQLLVLK